MIVHSAWRSRHQVRGALRVDRRGTRLAQAALSEHVVFDEVDDRLARDLGALSWLQTRRVLLHATCLDLSSVLSRFASVEWIDLEGAVATPTARGGEGLAGQLAPLRAETSLPAMDSEAFRARAFRASSASSMPDSNIAPSRASAPMPRSSRSSRWKSRGN
jgi:hypothetical protein